MKREQIMQAIQDLAKGQGRYQRLIQAIDEMGEEEYEFFMSNLEKQNFKDIIDIIFYFEE